MMISLRVAVTALFAGTSAEYAGVTSNIVNGKLPAGFKSNTSSRD